MFTPAVSSLNERERAALAALDIARRVLDMLEKKPMGRAPEPSPIHELRLVTLKRA